MTIDNQARITTMTGATELDTDMFAKVRQAQRQFLARIEPLRPDLHRYCRRLTGNLWDADDLTQETLTRAFARAGQTRHPVRQPLAWLLRVATNAYIDSYRRAAPTPVDPAAVELTATADRVGADPIEVRDALAEVSALLPPQERAAVVLKDVFDLPLADVAGLLETTVGAVKAALHRGRGRLSDPDRAAAQHRRPAPDRAVLDAVAAAFNAYDLDRLTALFRADGVSDVVGMVAESGREHIRAGSLTHTLVIESDVRYRAEVRELGGEPVVVLWQTPVDGSAPAAVADLLRCHTADGAVARMRWYYFCPETLTEAGELLGLPVRTHGYHH